MSKLETPMCVIISLLAERLEAASAERPPSEDRDVLVRDDMMAVDIGRRLIALFNEQEKEGTP